MKTNPLKETRQL